MAFRLPPLSSLRVFEAAARHGSFRKAAEELNLTASAVSHGVQTLESWLGAELFHREPRGLRLTTAGEAYAAPVQQALSLLAQATERLPGRQATGLLSVTSAPTFANRVLLPRLEKFAQLHPGIRVTIDTSQRVLDLALDDFDIAIRHASADKAGPDWTLLLSETLVPVCSPGLKAQLSGLPEAARLSAAPLIHTTSVATDWRAWLDRSGLEPPSSLERGLRVDTVQMAFDAAIRGFGVVMGRRPLVDEDLAAGRLVPLIDREIDCEGSHWLVSARSDFQKPEVKVFTRWLLAELGSARASRAQETDPAVGAAAGHAAPKRANSSTTRA